MAETPELAAQNAKFGYKAPESVYNKHKPGMAAQGAIGISWSVVCTRYDEEITREQPKLTKPSTLQLFSSTTGKAFTGVSPMDFYHRQNAAKKAERAKEAETKVGLYQNSMGKAFFSD